MTPERPHKIPESVLVVIHTAALEVLLIERADKPGFWQSVTGSKDAVEEALAETAVREVGEETGIVVGSPEVPLAHLRDWQLSNIYDIYPVWQHRYAPGVTRNTEHVFGLRVPREVPITLAPREHLAHQWLPGGGEPLAPGLIAGMACAGDQDLAPAGDPPRRAASCRVLRTSQEPNKSCGLAVSGSTYTTPCWRPSSGATTLS